MLVTVFGDSIVPIGGEVWLTHLFELAAPFGYSDRLIRTSMYRLVNEGWLESERVGRRSRYRLTEFATTEFASAEQRIYHRTPVSWNRQWTMVFTGTAVTEPADHSRLLDHLRWHGYAEMSANVWIRPEDGPEATTELLERLELEHQPPVASASFVDLEHLVSSGVLASSFSLDKADAAYQLFHRTYSRYENQTDNQLEPHTAFALRTMIVHDLRRARLVDPALPADALPGDWIGDTAFELAGDLYRRITDAAWTSVDEITGHQPDSTELVDSRFN